MKIGLGTVQFGIDYGVSNKCGIVSFAEQKKILNFAKQNGIKLLDTAIDYGESEKNLGSHGIKKFKIVTKLPNLPKKLDNVTEWLELQLNSSMKKLGITSFYGVLMHRSDQILSYDGAVYDFLLNQKKRGIIDKLGVSIYSPDELNPIINQISLDIVQAPINIIDRRIIELEWLKKLKKLNIEIHARSVFLQGLLLLPRNKIPKKFSRWNDLWDKWDHWHVNNPKTSPLQTCLNYVEKFSEIDQIIIGVQSLNEIQQIIDIRNKNVENLFPEMSCKDEELIHPSYWSSL